MSPPDETADETPAEAALEGGTYEIIRNRLTGHGRELRTRLARLNEARKDVFGAIELAIRTTDRITTPNNCIPRDMVALGGDRFLFGYNVQMGLKSETRLSDVFGLYDYRDGTFHALPLSPIEDERFEKDFKDLYRYYRGTRFAKFSSIGPHLFMVFSVGKDAGDVKTFKWARGDDGLAYVDNRSDHEFRYPPQLDFTWTRTHRDLHRHGAHPHISIEDRLFVEAVGGDITFKIEDNTETGQGIYAEPVENPDQTLDDAETFYAVMGHIILVRIRPYLEDDFRHFIFNEKTGEVHRVDAIAHACIRLPGDQGLIFANGYYLQTGELKRFETVPGGGRMTYERQIPSANGEDVLFVFYDRTGGDYLLLSYNRIEQAVSTPMPCNGYSLFPDGEMLVCKRSQEPTKHHVVQVWQTPYLSADYALSRKVEQSDSLLFKVGNPEIVRCMAECTELLKLVDREAVYSGIYVDIMKRAGEVADAYFWINRDDAANLKEPLTSIREAAAAAIDEFEKVVRLQRHTKSEVDRVSDTARTVLEKVRTETLDRIDRFVSVLADLRAVRGEIISLKELRYVDLEAVDKLETEVADATDRVSARCVEFLLSDTALDPYEARIDEIEASVDDIEKVVDADARRESVDEVAENLEMLIEIVSNLKIDDATQTTRIIDAISALYARLNGIRAAIKNRRKALQSAEGIAEFNAQMKLLSGSVANYLDVSNTPETCEANLTRIMITIEELEGRFADFDEFIVQLSEKRDEIYNAFETRKLSLIEARNRKADTLMSAGERILKGVAHRIGGMDDVDAINAYFASDLMIEKLRDIVQQLLDLDDTVKADDLQSRMKTVREDVIRRLKDRQELFVDGENVIRLGRHRFTVNVQALDITTVRREDRQYFHLTGTDFFEKVTDPAFEATRPVWDMEVPSESESVYRGEYLAFRMLRHFDETGEPPRSALDPDAGTDWEGIVRAFMAPRYSEGYVKGVHDIDGAKLFPALLSIHTAIGLLRYPPRVRALARVFWHLRAAGDERDRLAGRLRSFGMARNLFDGRDRQERYIAELAEAVAGFAADTGLFPEADAPRAGEYLFFELARRGMSPADEKRTGFVVSREAETLATGFTRRLSARRIDDAFAEARAGQAPDGAAEFELVRDWVRGYAEGRGEPELLDVIDEAAVMCFADDAGKLDVVDVPMSVTLDGMVGDHPIIENGVYRLRYLPFMERLTRHETGTVPRFNEYQDLKRRLTATKREEMRLDELKPRILSAFVRNRLINRVYLPLIGDNLAKQIGVAGEGKRTDLMGLLLVISPPGYGKTTLMEYIANRLGIIFVKINGPAIGHRVTSIDPADAPFASAREEIEKLNLALEMGDNVMIYLDDIQHCNPELLQKFISLCDAQRKIEGVYKGRSRTYDLRGKKVVVVMAGNPYTESGERFQIPDMLANRADTYNLGDIIGDSAEDFKMSYLENSLTSNPVLNRLASRRQEDVYGIIRIAETGSHEGVELTGNYSAEEVAEMVSVMRKLITVRDVILAVNTEYIHSAGQAEAYRTEPPFRLQGSYRNMNRIAEKVLSVMNDAELTTLIRSEYENEAQTLTTGAEANILKFKEITGWMTESERQRWEEIKTAFQRRQRFHGTDGTDPVNRVVAELATFSDGLAAIQKVIADGIQRMSAGGETAGTPAEIAIAPDTLRRLSALVAEMSRSAHPVTPPRSWPDAPMVPHATRSIHKMRRGNEFYAAIKAGDPERVRAFIDDGVNPNVTSSEGATPLMAAAFHNRPEIIRLLIDRGAEVNARDKDGTTALMIAAAKGHAGAAEELIHSGTDLNSADKNGMRPLDWARKNKHQEIVRMLEET